MTVITDLPFEIIDLIIRQLPSLEDLIRCAQTCRVLRWRAHHDLLWCDYLENIYAVTEYPKDALALVPSSRSVVNEYLTIQTQVQTAFGQLGTANDYAIKVNAVASLVDIPQFALYAIYHQLYMSGLYSSALLSSQNLLPRGPPFDHKLFHWSHSNLRVEHLSYYDDRESYMEKSEWKHNIEKAYWTRQFIKFWKHRASLRFLKCVANDDSQTPLIKFQDIIHSFHCFDGEYRHCVNEANMCPPLSSLPLPLLQLERVTSPRSQAQLIVHAMAKIYGIPNEREMTDPTHFYNINNYFIFRMGSNENHSRYNPSGFRGLPMTRLAVFLALANNYGLNARPVLFPLNVMARVYDKSNPVGSFYVDVYRHCRTFEWGDLIAMLAQWRMTPLPVHFAPASNKQIVQRCFKNLDLTVANLQGIEGVPFNHEILFLREIGHYLKLAAGPVSPHPYNLGFVETKLWQRTEPGLIARISTDWDMGLMQWLEEDHIEDNSGDEQDEEIGNTLYYAGQLVESPRLATFGVVVRRFRINHEYVYTVLSQDGVFYNIAASELNLLYRYPHLSSTTIAQFCRSTELGFFFTSYNEGKQVFVPGSMLAKRIPRDVRWHNQRDRL